MEELEKKMMERVPPEVLEVLKKSKIAVAGSGGLGSNITLSLARIGVGEISIFDFDVVEASNLNRQQYFVEDIGKGKVQALKDLISRVNPFVKINAHHVYLDQSNIKELLSGHDIIIEAFDNPECKATLSNIVLTELKESYLITGSGMAGYYSSNLIQTRRVTKRLYVCGDGENEYVKEIGIMAPRVCITANHMANMAIRLLLKEEGV
ncbi:MAG: sulfur carrier protein ThiS adenylyltransferase ThiF [Clostridium sp.]